MTAKASQLVQLRPADTNAATALTATVSIELTKIVICNTSGAAATCRIYHDEDGTTYDETTALLWDRDIPVGTPVILNSTSEEAGFTIGPAGSLGIRSSVADALTFTLYGVSQDVQGRDSVRGEAR